MGILAESIHMSGSSFSIDLLAVSVGVLTFIVNFCFATGVFRNAENLLTAKRLNFVGPWVWFFATLLGGVFVASAYWVMHHSRLNPAVPLAEPEEQPS